MKICKFKLQAQKRPACKSARRRLAVIARAELSPRRRNPLSGATAWHGFVLSSANCCLGGFSCGGLRFSCFGWPWDARLRARRKPPKAAGAQLGDVTQEEAAQLGWEVPRGAKVVKPRDGSPAAVAGLQPGDIAVTLDGMDIENAAGFDAGGIAAKAPGAARSCGCCAAARRRRSA